MARTSLLNSVLNLAICGLAFAFSNLGGQTLRGVSLAPERVLSNRTPIAAAEFLNRENVKKDPAIFVPAEWSGYVLYATDARVRTLVNLHVHVMPEQLWADYMQILAGEEDALKLLDRYQIRVVMTDRSRNRGLIQRLLDSGEFRLAYEDGQAMILECGTR